MSGFRPGSINPGTSLPRPHILKIATESSTNFKICQKTRSNSPFLFVFPDFWPQVDSTYDSMMLDQWKWKAIVAEKSFQELIIMEQVKFSCQKQNKTYFLIELVLLKLQAVNLCVKIFQNVKIFFLQKSSFKNGKKYLNCTLWIKLFSTVTRKLICCTFLLVPHSSLT